MMQGALKEVCTAFQRYFKGNAQSQATLSVRNITFFEKNSPFSEILAPLKLKENRTIVFQQICVQEDRNFYLTIYRSFEFHFERNIVSLINHLLLPLNIRGLRRYKLQQLLQLDRDLLFGSSDVCEYDRLGTEVQHALNERLPWP